MAGDRKKYWGKSARSLSDLCGLPVGARCCSTRIPKYISLPITGSHASCLIIPLSGDLFYPETGVAALELLEKLNVDAVYSPGHTCCGQPTANSGCYVEAQATDELFIGKCFRF